MRKHERFLQDNPDILVVLAGGNFYDDVEKEIEARGLAHKYFITGNLENRALLGFLELSSLVIIPSLSEGFGITAIEAMSLGKTILCSNTGGLPEIIRDGENGFLFEKGNDVDLIKKLELLHEKNSKEIVNKRNLRAEFLEKYSCKPSLYSK